MEGRYRFYRVHKLIIALVNDVSRFIAKVDFADAAQFSQVREKINNIVSLMRDHAEHEDIVFHALLEAKGASDHKSVAEEHQHYKAVFQQWGRFLDEIEASDNPEFKVQKGYEFYLAFRDFEAENILHLNEEERVVMGALQNHYSDDELRAVEEHVFQKEEMTPQVIAGMLTQLFPYMNRYDQDAFLSAIKSAAPEKFSVLSEENNALFDESLC